MRDDQPVEHVGDAGLLDRHVQRGLRVLASAGVHDDAVVAAQVRTGCDVGLRNPQWKQLGAGAHGSTPEGIGVVWEEWLDSGVTPSNHLKLYSQCSEDSSANRCLSCQESWQPGFSGS
jgi:hypothetical protein